MSKIAASDHPVHELIAQRWSPYDFSNRPVSDEDLRGLFEAARWAASSYNEQPWTYIVATQKDPEAFAKVLACLVEPNQAWAQAAPVLVLCCTSGKFSRNGKPNGCALHDLGLAAGNICLEATARGLSIHQMAGILPAKAVATFGVPEGVQVATAMAIGYATEPQKLSENFKQTDTEPRQRKPLSEFVFSGRWGDSSSLVK